jgi:hypothetical protein
MRILEPYKNYFWDFYNPLRQNVKDKFNPGLFASDFSASQILIRASSGVEVVLFSS